MFGIQTKDISRTTQIFKDNILGCTKKNYVTKAFDVMNRLLNGFDVSKNERLQCIKLCKATEDCVDLMSKTPNSVCSAILWIQTGIPKTEICQKCAISVPTLNKIEGIIRKYLEVKVE